MLKDIIPTHENNQKIAPTLDVVKSNQIKPSNAPILSTDRKDEAVDVIVNKGSTELKPS